MILVSFRLRIRFFSPLFFAAIGLWLALASSAMAAEPLININTAPPAKLAEQLPGIGPAKARAIVVYREQYGPFTTLEQLTEVKGIGPSTLEKIRPFIYIDTDDLQQTSGTSVEQGVPLIVIGKTQIEHDKASREAVRAVMKNALRDLSGSSP